MVAVAVHPVTDQRGRCLAPVRVVPATTDDRGGRSARRRIGGRGVRGPAQRGPADPDDGRDEGRDEGSAAVPVGADDADPGRGTDGGGVGRIPGAGRSEGRDGSAGQVAGAPGPAGPSDHQPADHDGPEPASGGGTHGPGRARAVSTGAGAEVDANGAGAEVDASGAGAEVDASGAGAEVDASGAGAEVDAGAAGAGANAEAMRAGADVGTDADAWAGAEVDAGAAGASGGVDVDAGADVGGAPAGGGVDAGGGRVGAVGPWASGSDAIGAVVRAATTRLLTTFVEVVGGFRPVFHLRELCRPDRFEHIVAHLRGRPVGTRPPHQRGGLAFAGRLVVVGRMPGGAPPRHGRAAQRCPGDRLCVRRVQLCQVTADAAEVVAVVSRRGASAAVAFRLERAAGRWLCVHLEIV